jgi:glutamate formiminotransferase
MVPPLVECVPNISEGRELLSVDRVQAAICSVPGVLPLHRTSDWDHNRSVLTFAAPPDVVVEAAVQAVAEAARNIDLTRHVGVHPRVGALDVLPFVPLHGVTMQECVHLAHAAGARIASELGIPVYFYAEAALQPFRKRLEDVRRGQFEGLLESAELDPAKAPDLGGPRLHPTAGAVIIGARKVLIAFNVNLNTPDVALARHIASQIRERSGGFPGVKALGLALESRQLAQVSMNITDHEASPLHVVYKEIERLANNAGVEVLESELIGLMPRQAMETAAAGFLRLTNWESSSVLEARIDAARQEGS